MSRFLPAVEKIKAARLLIEKARGLPLPDEGGKYNFSYISRVKAFLQDARDLVKFIPKTPSASPEMKAEVAAIFREADQADRDLLH
jgi:hypothetical protein